MKTYKIREYNGNEDLPRMQDLVSSYFNIKSDLHIGDIAWQRFQHENMDQTWHTYLVEDAEKLVAWGWLDPHSNLILAVHPSRPEVTSVLIDKFLHLNFNVNMTIDIFRSEEHIIKGLLDNGFKEKKNGPFYLRMYRNLENLPYVNFPDGFSARFIDVNTDFEKRVDVHREVWHPSKVTYLSYRNVISTSTYNPRLDWVAAAPDGTFASYCLIWYDENTRIGLLEPVGTSPRFRRIGLSKAVCTMALKELRRMGGKGAIVNSRGDREHQVSAQLYQSMGFKPLSRTRSFIKEF